ncbi:MAG: family 43 glycosylhydrolase [Lentisphaerae bacterium]|nr:family 43 glycosylhydrolase [Lentisphaerota bacterium]MBT4815507.1 family 43 glycosylhydrolase [Lentisphaerota bacterium]MBT5606487.1 family 43 glycosylhydrolase [Lentisphaerota bacterium]MBT7058853.1 family 43 glycosylhydrolase [Lentisphaerota bacterium]MBT7846486.1 family 43 glycosylhydrolase [Lentisphaerota bacterium]
MYYADDVSGRPLSKDPAVVRLGGTYWLYYSIPPYEGKLTTGWTIGVATSNNLTDWVKAGELTNTGDAEARGFTAPGAIVLDGKIHLFYQTYGNADRDAICHAWSEDGLSFTRNPTNPIFRPAGEWNNGRAIDADVIPHSDRLLLYWATRDPQMKVQMQGVAAAPLSSEFSRQDWVQLNPDGPILAPTVPTHLDDPDLDLSWEKDCIEAAAMARHNGRLYMFYAGAYNNAPQQIGVAVSDNGVDFRRLSDRPFVPNGPPGSWNSSESGHPFFFQDDDGQDYLFYQGNNTGGKTWHLSVIPIDWVDAQPVPAHKQAATSV